MLSVAAIDRFRAAQLRLLSDTYDTAWRHAVDSYEPLPRQVREADQPDDQRKAEALAALAALGAVGRVLANRLGSYQPPQAPDPVRKAQALGPAANGVDRMAGQLAYVTATAEQIAAANGDYQAANAAALEDWAASNGWRLTNGDSVAWAGEQDGFAQSATADGQLLVWDDSGDERECADCEGLANLPPMVEFDWPTTPGAGATECSANCRCSLDTYDDGLNPQDILNVADVQALIADIQPSADDEAVLARIAGNAAPQPVG